MRQLERDEAAGADLAAGAATRQNRDADAAFHRVLDRVETRHRQPNVERLLTALEIAQHTAPSGRRIAVGDEREIRDIALSRDLPLRERMAGRDEQHQLVAAERDEFQIRLL